MSASAENQAAALETVGVWRGYARNEAFALGYANGVMVGGFWMWSGCRDFSAGELAAYLKYTADAKLYMAAAATKFYLDHDCRRLSDAEMRAIFEKAAQTQ